MNLILSAVALIMTKKVPTDIGVSKIDNLHNKVRLLAPQFFQKGEALNDCAVIRVVSGQRQPPMSPNSSQSDEKES